MKLHLESGITYFIPKGMKYANLSIAMTKLDLEITKNSIKNPMYIEYLTSYEKEKKSLIGFSHIGYEEIEKEDILIHLHWFIRREDLHKCKWEGYHV